MLVLVACLSSALSSAGYDFYAQSNGQNLFYNITGSSTVEVTYRYSDYDVQATYSGSITIPSTVTYNGSTYTVTAIGNFAFYNDEERIFLTSISIPSTVTTIGDYAFYRQSKLTSVTLPSSLQSIGESAFKYCSLLTSITIPNSVPTIYPETFGGCSSLTSVVIGNGVTSIGYEAFYGCSSLTSLSIGNKVETIYDSAFENCNITTVSIPNSVTTIYDRAFRNCPITTLYLGFRVEEIGNYAFYAYKSNGYPYLQDVYCYAAFAPSIQTHTFYSQDIQYAIKLHILAISYSDSQYGYQSSEWNNFYSKTTISGSTAYDTQIGGLYYQMVPWPESPGYYAKVVNNGNYNCYTSSSYTVPATVSWRSESFIVRYIENSAFRNCTNVSTLDLRNATNLNYIRDYACYGCTGLSTVYLSPSIRTIGDYAFYNSGLSKLYTNNSTPPTIYSNTFSTRYNYCYVYVPYPKDIATYQAATYWSNFRMILSEQNYDFVSDGIYYRITGSNTVEVTCEDPDNHCSYTGNVSVPATVTWNGTTYNVTAIGEWAFSEARQVNLTAGTSQRGYTPGSLKSVSLPSSVTIIKPYAFSWCTGLTQVSIGSGVTTIDDYAFYYSTALTTITIPNSVTTLGRGAFGGCTALKSVTLGSGLTSIGNDAFSDCPFKYINCLRTTPPTITSSTFTRSQYSSSHLVVPNNALSAYSSATNWSNFSSKRTIDQVLANAVKLSGDVTLTTSGTYPWVMQYDGSRTYATSGNYGQHSTSSVMTGTATVPANCTGTLTFDFKAWGEGAGVSYYDRCIFAVDGVTKFTYAARDNAWENYSVELTAGTHTLTWTYSKDGSVNPTGDYFAVDNVKLVTQASVVTGDVNGDGSTTIADVTALIDSLLSGVEVPLDAADVNGDGSVTIADVTALIDMLLGS